MHGWKEEGRERWGRFLESCLTLYVNQIGWGRVLLVRGNRHCRERCPASFAKGESLGVGCLLGSVCAKHKPRGHVSSFLVILEKKMDGIQGWERGYLE